MRKLLRTIARDLLIVLIAMFAVWTALRIYVAQKIKFADSLAEDFRQVITSHPPKQQVDAFFAKYRQFSYAGGLIIVDSPRVPWLPKPDNEGYCIPPDWNENLAVAIIRRGWLRFAETAGFSCFRLAATVGIEGDGEVSGNLGYQTINGLVLRVIRGAEPPNQRLSSIGRPPYMICISTPRGFSGIRVEPDAPRDVVLSITQINSACFRRYEGCSFSEILPGAAAQWNKDMQAGVDSCHIR